MSGEKPNWPDWDDQLNDPETTAARRRDMADSVIDYRNQGRQGNDWAEWLEPNSGVRYRLDRRVHPTLSKYFYQLTRSKDRRSAMDYSLIFSEVEDRIVPAEGHWPKNYAREEPEEAQKLFHQIIQNALFHAFDTPPPRNR